MSLRTYAAANPINKAVLSEYEMQSVQDVQSVQSIQDIQNIEDVQEAEEAQEDNTRSEAKAERERAKEAEQRRFISDTYKRQQAASVQASGYKSDILKGLKRGENIYSLFLTATKCIACICSDPLFSELAERDILCIYGEALHRPQALSLEYQAVNTRLDNLRAYKANERPQGTNADATQSAIEAHVLEAARIEKLIALERNRPA